VRDDGIPDPGELLVIGLGNFLLGDDGVGVHAVRALAVDPPAGALTVEVGTALLDALPLLEDARRVVAIDAMQAGGPPGTVYAFGPEDVARAATRTSLHELGLVAALDLLPPGRPRPDISIIGVEPVTIDFGLELSPPVREALPLVLETVKRLIARPRS